MKWGILLFAFLSGCVTPKDHNAKVIKAWKAGIAHGLKGSEEKLKAMHQRNKKLEDTAILLNAMCNGKAPIPEPETGAGKVGLGGF